MRRLVDLRINERCAQQSRPTLKVARRFDQSISIKDEQVAVAYAHAARSDRHPVA